MTQPVHIVGPQFSTFVRSVQLCCEEKSIPYTLGTEAGGRSLAIHSPEHYALHPFGKVPILLHGERRLIETPSICRYLDAAFDGPALQPAETWARAQTDQWTGILAGYVDQALVRRYLLEFVFPKGEGGTVREDAVADARPGVVKVLTLLEEQLAEEEYLVGGDFTIADAIAAPMLDYLAGLPGAEDLFAETPRLVAYIERVRGRPAASRVLVAPDLGRG
ncbi:glutathione S-transferase family protein [Halomonas elongata]|uniref:glutathione transferase n=1 Tax=Halomonas elongata (strain ATCC 33173 / DSM 2581 / NBRC 15536 / NCIMB 2198 / 1H9) TaxID=768066 RepID=E1V536_HALED|nr:glutathione S-transferase family protein [Halomonas elongata]WBF18322.1 glutathione S-transferase family protein [Halomonas elongata]WPU47174.1 glutathione S-transferase family protein [Halomonas elongata DSM 2581]CBV41085.1 glutathione S-transferase domain protein [Halomonas elongata DSM 2581]